MWGRKHIGPSIILIVMILLSKCISATGPIPDDDNPIAYVHVENEEDDPGTCWMNTNIEDSESESSNHQSRRGFPFEGMLYNITVKEGIVSTDGLENAIYMNESDSQASFEVHLLFESGEPSHVSFRINEDEDIIDFTDLAYEEDGRYIGSLNIPGRTIIEEGNALRFYISWDMEEGMTNEWYLFCNNDSLIHFPIASDSDNDGVPDYLDEPDDPNNGTGNQTNDPDPPIDGDADDDDGIPGFEAAYLLIATAVIAFHRRHTFGPWS